jgi:hypothetical protein
LKEIKGKKNKIKRGEKSKMLAILV